MAILAGNSIRHAFGTHVILDGASLSIASGERIGIVGRNGSGKTTLLRILAGADTPDAGEVAPQRGARLGYLAQNPDLDPEQTLRGAAEAAFADLHRMHRELDALFERMAGAEDDELERLLARQAELERKIEAEGGFAIEHRVDAVLHGLGFDDSQFAIRVRDLSGGQRARVALARLLLEDPDVILLDEPTNHLDIDGRLWLESFLADTFKGAALIISHDRYLLDRVVGRIVEVERGSLIDYPGNYSRFRELRAERREAMRRAYEKEQHRFKREEAFIRKYKAGQRAKQARGRESRLERAKAESPLEQPVELATFSFHLPPAPRTGDIVASARELTKAYTNDDGSEKVLFRDLTLSIGRGERWGIVGPNGAGKTTLVRTLLGEVEPTAGSVAPGSRLRIGYFRQTEEHVEAEVPLIRHLQRQIIKENPDRPLSEQEARDLAGAFLFSGLDQDKEMGVLSGGERGRVRLAALLASAKNVLVLDEPTNHLDIPSAERLEEALSPGAGYEGTLMLITHDRALIDATCDHLLVLDGVGGATVYHGNYSQWRDHLARASQNASPRPPRPTGTPNDAAGPNPRGKPATSDAPPSTGRASAPNGQPAPAHKSRFSWMKPDQLEARIGELEHEIGAVDAELADPEVWREPDRANALTDRRDRLKSELAEIEEEWLRKTL